MNEKFTLFYGHHPRYGPRACFSQWYPCEFTVHGDKYNCAEQYMMAAKARLFKDQESLDKIMNAAHPRDQKKYGREVKNYNDAIWQQNSVYVVMIGSINKFNQNKDLYNILMLTGDTTLVECSPTDKIWGIGLSIKDPRCLDRSEWLGENRLGQILTDVRDILKCMKI